jgi:hypothetical protein
MNNFSRDNNGIWVTGNQNYDVKYWASSHQNNEAVEDEEVTGLHIEII